MCAGVFGTFPGQAGAPSGVSPICLDALTHFQAQSFFPLYISLVLLNFYSVFVLLRLVFCCLLVEYMFSVFLCRVCLFFSDIDLFTFLSRIDLFASSALEGNIF